MALNVWWENDPEQRYWMEIFTGDDPGNQLLAPQLVGGHWSYELPSLVKPGDVIFHFSTVGARAGSIVGWSIAQGPAETLRRFHWEPRGASGRANQTVHSGKGWKVRLGGVNDLGSSVNKSMIQGARADLMQLKAELQEKVDGSVYFPWYEYGGNQLRAQQGYLTKFPKEVLNLLPGLKVARPSDRSQVDDELVEDTQRPGGRAPKGRVTRAQDPVLRKAIETHAVNAAIDHYTALGATRIKELGKPYDIWLQLHGIERHCEVKGSSMRIDTVELTINEVVHGQTFTPTDLIVVDQIQWERNPDGTVTTSGGQMRVWSDWSPLDDDLAARKFAYNLPPVPGTDPA
ncbi:DUF3883 domain-containing protein [Nocardioides panacisoli]|uniref:DUF3883 domain-containing protein n=1 Tax=Nocardioides panacisoli TaxID=627624 RepID=UPI001C626A8B|nr:DUF3883 domain-containing protein [Nocardioides panacisoli]QYJ04227.1 DUF3883 domain-containing protein [Nocardioides panacisoli]